MDRADQLVVLSGAAADQWGLVTTAQAKELGLNAVQLLRLTEAGLLENVSRGVYFLATGAMPQHVDIKAAWLRLQPREFAWNRPLGHPDSGVVSHASACRLHELGDIPAPDVEITVPRRRTTNEPFVRLRTASLEPADITVADGLPVTTAARTVIDLLQAKADGGHIGGVIAEAERRGLITVDDLAERVWPYARKYGLKATATGRDLIDHLVAQAGESLRRQEVDRAGQEGFDAAVRLFAGHPAVASYLARSGGMNDIGRALGNLGPNAAAAAAMRRVLDSDPAMRAALAKFTQPNQAVLQVLRHTNADALSPSTRKAMEAVAKFQQQPVPPPAPRNSGTGSGRDDSRPAAEETG